MPPQLPGHLLPPMALVKGPERSSGEGRGRRGGRGGGEGQGGSAAQFVAKVFLIFFSPYVKSARKLSSLFATVSSVSWGRGEGGTPGLAPQLATEGGLILLRNVGFSLNTRQ